MPLKGGISNWIKDFKKSDAPQFKGKSNEKIRDMAIAAYLDAKNEERLGEATAKVDSFTGHKHAKRAGMGVKVHGSSMMGGDHVTLSHPDKKKLQKYVDNHLGGAEQGVHVKESVNKPTRLKTYLNESTNWKGTEHIGLTRYSAQKGFGLQLSQHKRMGNEKFRMGAHVSMPMKDVPKLIKALQKVFKAKEGTQLGDAD